MASQCAICKAEKCIFYIIKNCEDRSVEVKYKL